MKKNIVILGGGFGGLQTALYLSRDLKKLSVAADYEIIIVDREPYHTFTPLLYEVAATSKETADYLELKSLVAYSLQEILSDKNINIVTDEVLHIDLPEGLVHLKKSKIKYNYLVIALGAEVNYFGIKGLKEKVLSFKTFDDALRVRNAIWSRVEEGAKNLKIVIGGAGATGVELAGEIEEWVCEIEEQTHQACTARVTIINAGETVLPGFDEKVVNLATKRLKKLGVILMNGQIIESVQKNKVKLQSGDEVPFDVLIWAGGVKAMALTEKMPLKKEKRGRIEIAGHLECLPESPDLKVSGKIYAVGDVGCVYDPRTGTPVPQVVRPAIRQGRVAAKNIIESIKKENRLAGKVKQYIYKPWNYPYIIPIGGKYAIAKFGPFVFSGFLTWVFKGIVELEYLLRIFPFLRGFKIWLTGF